MQTPVSYEDYRARRHFPGLDGLRAIGIGLVMWEHSRNRAIAGWSHGLDGVVLFFVLSGFLITTLCAREEAQEPSHRVNLRALLLRRAFRILPLYYLVLGVYVLLIAAAADPRRVQFLHALPYYATILQEVPHFRFPNVPFEIAWAIGVELKFYLIWPLIAFGLLAGMPRQRLAVTTALAVFATLAPQLGSWGNFVFYEGTILWGCVAALLLHDPRTYPWLAWLGRPWALVAVSLVAIVVHTHTLSYNSAAANVLVAPAFALVVAGLVVSRARWPQVLDSRFLVSVGVASYVIYLIHQLALHISDRLIPARFGAPGDVAVLVIGAAAAIAVGLPVHRYFEERMTELGRRLSRRWWPRVVPDQPQLATQSG